MTELEATLSARQPEAELRVFRDELTMTIGADALIATATLLRDDPDLAFDYLADLTGVDFFPRVPRFDVAYHLYSMKHNHRLRLEVPIDGETPKLESVVSIWPAANWHEREVFDLLGIEFVNHPDLRRILMPEDWEGYPLRKDYPLLGHQDPVERWSGGRTNFEQ